MDSGEETAQATSSGPQAALTSTATPGTSPSPTPTASATKVSAEDVERVAEQQGGLDQRLAAAEQRLTRLDLQAQAAAGNAARAEGLLIAFAVRRAIDRGAELGYLADQLRLRFGDALPNAVNTIISFSREPVTLDQLIARLDGLAPQLQSGDDRGGFERFTEELGALFTIRRESAPSPQPEMRLERARLFLLSGRPDDAVAEVRNLPGASQADQWLRDAERYASTQRALDLIETAAVLEPRRLRDGAGNRISQPSPAEE
ncbi:MICOS complex subunit MIC60 [Qipengyuania aquimaris]|nr:MICOS complex subunit MIC60 [Qipengyuania aquimaris]